MSSNKDGKKIERIHLGEKKVIIKFSDSKLDISKSAYLELMPYEGKVLTEEDIKQIKKIDELDKYLTYAKKIILSSSKSETQIRDKLIKKGAKTSQINHVINELKQYSLIDDESYMDDLVESMKYKLYGKERIKKFLYNKGISKNLVESYKFDENDELVRARLLLKNLDKKFDKYNYKLKKDHIYQALLRNGYTSEISSKIIKEININDPKHELEVLKKDYIKIKNRYIKKYNKDELDFKINQYLLSKGYKFSDIEKVKGE